MPAGSLDGGEVLLNQQVLRGLGDKLYDKRKLAALEVEQLVKNLAREARGPGPAPRPAPPRPCARTFPGTGLPQPCSEAARRSPLSVTGTGRAAGARGWAGGAERERTRERTRGAGRQGYWRAVVQILDRLTRDYAYSPQANCRKGGLLALAAAAVALAERKQARPRAPRRPALPASRRCCCSLRWTETPLGAAGSAARRACSHWTQLRSCSPSASGSLLRFHVAAREHRHAPVEQQHA